MVHSSFIVATEHRLRGVFEKTSYRAYMNNLLKTANTEEQPQSCNETIVDVVHEYITDIHCS